MNTKLHAVTDANGRPISFFMTAGQVSDYTGAAALLDSLPKAQWMLADRGYDAAWFRDALQEKGITPCIPGRKIRNKTVKYDKRRCLIPRFDGAILSLEWKEAIWDRYVTGAPRPRTPSEQQYSDRRLRSRR
jgi:transposase